MILINKKRYSKKLIIIITAIIFVIAIPLAYVYIFNGNLFGWSKSTSQNITPDNSINYGPATQEQQKAGNQTKSSSNDIPVTPDTTTGSNKRNIQVTITAADQNESILQIRTMISAVENTGICTLTLTNAERPSIIKTSNIQSLASSSTCQGFDIPTSELLIGTWNILISFSNDTLTGSATTNVVIK